MAKPLLGKKESAIEEQEIDQIMEEIVGAAMIYPLDSYVGQMNVAYCMYLTQSLMQDLFTTGDLGISRRLINYWDTEDILTAKRGEGEKWRHYSFIEYVWLNIVAELRKINYPLAGLRVMKKTLLAPLPLKKWAKELKKNPDGIQTQSEEDEQLKELVLSIKLTDYDKMDSLPLLAWLVVESILMKKNIALIVPPDGKWFAIEPGKENEITAEQHELLIFGTYSRVSLTGVLKVFMNDKVATEFLPKLNILQPREQKLLEIVNSGEFDTITIHFKDRKPEYIEAKKSQDVKRRIVDILQENEYQQVVIKRHQGVTTTIENTVRLYMDEKKEALKGTKKAASTKL